MSVPDPPWQAAPRARPARAPLSQDAIVHAALRVLDREGSAGLSMRRVAEELGTGPASLYWHVANKDALINLIIDQVAGEVAVPEPDPDRWQEQLREWLLGVRRVFERHPGVAALTLGRVPTGPNVLRWACCAGPASPTGSPPSPATCSACTWGPPATRRPCPR
jgi:AcrR family transcriptional regulator